MIEEVTKRAVKAYMFSQRDAKHNKFQKVREFVEDDKPWADVKVVLELCLEAQREVTASQIILEHLGDHSVSHHPA